MGRIVGIDLGTTYSAVTIPEERHEDGFMVIPGCPGYSVILDRQGHGITPSVVAEDDDGNIIVGREAKARAGLAPGPVMFAKRSMGEDVTFQLDRQGSLRPEEVSAHILHYLRELAEERLGEPVEEAVITVPAYFTLRAKQMTEKAGEMAGLKVAQIAQEPVAAALMYCAGDARDPLRVMTYDLGGGTFDVSILEKRDGVISNNSIRAFDGDRFLGGYNFDKELAFWILDQLNEQGYDLDLDLEQPGDRVIFAKLMVYAEEAKIALTDAPRYKFPVQQTGIVDHAGKAVELHTITVTRELFEGMIADKVEYSIGLCHRALEKVTPPIKVGDLDEILMVGGSSRIPLVGRRLREEFRRDPRLVDPDLCVALGAGIVAGTQPKVVEHLELDHIPSKTDMPDVTVTGQVLPGVGLPIVEGCTVTLRATDGSYHSSRATRAGGGFSFEDVPLAEEETTDFVLTVTGPDGQEVVAHHFSVEQTGDLAGGGLVDIEAITNVLSKPIMVVFDDGPYEVAAERTPLSYKKKLRAKTKDTSGEIRLPVLEENAPLGEVVMSDVPTDLPIGSAVEVTLTFEKNYQIQGKMRVLALEKEIPIEIAIPIPARKSIDELRDEYERLAAQAENVMASASSSVLLDKGRGKRLKALMKEAKDDISSRDPELPAIQERLSEMETLVREIGAGWRPEPPRAVLEMKAQEAKELLGRAIAKKPEVAQDGYDQQIKAIQDEAEQAFANQNGAAWKDAFSKMVKLCDRLDALIPSRGQQVQQDPAAILLSLEQQLNQLKQRAEALGCYRELEEEFEEVAKALERIGPQAPDAMNQIRDWYYTRYKNLENKVGTGLLDKEKHVGILIFEGAEDV